MIATKNKNICVLPVHDGGITKPFGNGHNGTDWGWAENKYSYIHTIQDGVIRDVGYGGTSQKIGYYITLEHQYEDGTRRFSGYIHLQRYPFTIKNGNEVILKKGDVVKVGDVLGCRGGSPYYDYPTNSRKMFNEHLHLYTTSTTTKQYSWETMKSLAIDPFSQLTFCKLKSIDYSAMAKQDGHNFGATAPYYEDMISDTGTDEVANLKEQIAELTQEINYLSQEIEADKITIAMLQSKIDTATKALE